MKQNHFLSAESFPFRSRDVGLSENPGEQFSADIALMCVRHGQREIALEHEGMSAAGIRTVEACGAKGADQLSPRDWAKGRH